MKKTKKKKIKEGIDGGWPKHDIPQSSYDKIHKIALEEGGQDYSCSPRLEVTVIDRTEYESLHYFPVKYAHKNDANNKEILETLLLNVRLAADALNRFVSCYGSSIIK